MRERGPHAALKVETKVSGDQLINADLIWNVFIPDQFLCWGGTHKHTGELSLRFFVFANISETCLCRSGCVSAHDGL